MQVERIDLYQVHAFDPLTPIEETLQFLDDATRRGTVLNVGLSNFTGWKVQKTLEFLDKATAPDAPDYPYGSGGASQRSRVLPGPSR